MAKQIYIDENGNPIEVSGTINNASMLPISGNDSTDTKTYIDNVVTSGSNANGYYVKYADGTMICTKTVMCTINTNEWSAWGTLYESISKDVGNYAQEFYSTPVVNLSVVGNASFIERLSSIDKTGMGNVVFVRPTVPGSSQVYAVQIVAVGRWKA